MNFFKQLLLPLALLCSMAVPMLAQIGQQAGDVEVNGVTANTLNVHVAIPVATKPGIGLPTSVSLNFNNNFWTHVVGQWTPGGPGFGGQYGWATADFLGKLPTSNDCQSYPYYNIFIDGAGNTHQIPGGPIYTHPGGGSYCTHTTVDHTTIVAIDGSGLTYNLSYNPAVNTVVGADGSVISLGTTPNKTVVDVNGNTVSYSATTLTDTFGVAEVTASSVGNTCGTLMWPNNVFTYPTSTGTATVTINCTPYTIQSSFGCTGITEWGPNSNIPLVSSIVLGDGSSYLFTYESAVANTVTGRLASVTYPSGKVVSYTYGSADCNTGIPRGLTQVSSDGTRIYAWGLGQTTVTSPAPANNKLVYTWSAGTPTSNPNAYITQIQTYQGASTLLKTVTVCYNNTQMPNCVGASMPSTVQVTQTDTYTQLAGMSTSSRSTTFFDNYGDITESDVYDFGATTPAKKRVVTGYGHTWNGSTSSPNCTSFIGNGVNDRPCLVQTTDGSNNLLTSSYFQYSTTGHPSKTGTLVSGSYVTSSATYNANGTLAGATDVNGNPSSLTYGVCSGGRPSVVTPPITLLAIGVAWDSGCVGAKVTTVTDPNGAIVTASYNDPFWRTTSVQDPLNNVVNTYYTSPTEAETIFNFNSGVSTNDVYSKEYPLSNSRESQSLEAPSSSNWDTSVSDFIWDATGVVSEAWMPCVATSKGTVCVAAKSTVTHDAIGRPLVKTDGGGGTVTYSYVMGSSKYDVLAILGPAPTGEVVKKVQKEYNGLGQLLSVCKLSSASGTTSCGQVGGGTGFLTTFSYNPNGTLASAVRGSQTHSATYDNVGRVLTSTTPEGGLTQFFYDSAPSTPGVACSTLPLPTGNLNISPIGHLVKTYDANGTTACYSYDQMGRKTGIAYSGTNWDGNNKYFVYDSATVHSVVMTHVLGRLAEAYTAPTVLGTKVTDEGFSYTLRGERSDVYQWSTHSGGWYHTTATYFDNGALKTLAGITGGTWTYGLDGKGRLSTALQGTASEVTSVTFNAADQPLVITLGLGDKDTYTYDSNTGRMSSYDFAIKATPVHLTGTLSWNANGTLRGLTVVDGINTGAPDSEACSYGDATHPGYDEIGRLLKVDCWNGATAVWGQNFAYDAYDNLSKTVPSGQTGTTWIPNYSATNNRYSTATYDPNGNLLTDTFHTYTWNQDNHPKAITDAGLTMTYDAFGRMVEKYNGATYQQELISPIGPVALMTGQTVTQFRIPLPGGATALNGINFEHKDWLGSSAFVSSRGRAAITTKLFSPYGEIYNNTGIAGDVNFTGDRQDLVAGLYDTPNRELNPSGRWISPDPAGASWNAYQYSTNPMGETDPSGLAFSYAFFFTNPDSDSFGVFSTKSMFHNGGFDEFDLLDPRNYVGYGYDPNHQTEGESYRYWGIEDGTWIEPHLVVDPTHGGNLSDTSCSNCEGNNVAGSAQEQKQDAGVKAPPSGEPPVDPPPGKGPNGEPNEWVKIPGTDDKQYGPQYGPKYPVPDTPGGSQPRVWWDPHDGWWSHENGRGDPREHYDRWGNKVNKDDKPSLMDKMKSITPGPIIKLGAWGIVVYIIIDEGSRFVFPARNLVPVP